MSFKCLHEEAGINKWILKVSLKVELEKKISETEKQQKSGGYH